MNEKSLHTRAQIALFLGLAANAAGQSFLLVVLPPLGRRLGFSDLQTGAILGVSALLLIVSAPIWGYVSERIGRKPVLLIALAGATLAPAAFSAIVGRRLDGAMPALSALILFFVTRSLQTMICGGLLPASQAFVADITEPRQRSRGMGLIGAATGLGGVIGAALAWQVGGADAVSAFALVAALVCVAFVSVLLLVEEARRDDARPTYADIRLPLERIWPFLAITLVAISAYGMLQQVLALRLQDALGFSHEESIAKAGAALMATALAMVVVQGVALRVLVTKPEQLLSTGAAMATLSLVLGSLGRSYLEIFCALILFGVAIGLMFPGNLSSISLRAGSGAQGKAAGVNVIGQGLGLAIGPIAGASLHRLSPQAPFIVSSLLFALAWGLAIFARRSTNCSVSSLRKSMEP
jgi:DHA1 family tetracycline resistance protein-like MFS transporter